MDETGRRVWVPAHVERIISLAPNLTEIVYALGLEARLVGVTNLCNFPPAARTKPRVGDVLNPSVERIVELRPDLVLGTTAGNRRATVEALEHVGLPLYGINPRSVENIFTSIQHVAELAGVPHAGEKLVARLRARLGTLEARLRKTRAPRVLFVLWLEPLITVGNDTFLNDVLQRARADSITAHLALAWPRLSVEEVIERNPGYLVFPRTESIQKRWARLAGEAPWRQLEATRHDRIVWLDEAILRPGPRIVEALEELARALHPDAFHLREVAEK
ncbi:MAG: ABC transporter substrate-binding protein [Terriglobia bacterium]